MTELIEDIGEHLLSSQQKLQSWGPGEWVEEADLFKFEYKKYECLVCRVFHLNIDDSIELGHLCGYVQIPEGHDWNNKSFDHIDCDVHGGLTYAQLDVIGNFSVGFDCCHNFDITPGIEKFLSKYIAKFPEWMQDSIFDGFISNRSYKNMKFVIEQLKKVVDQAIAAQAS